MASALLPHIGQACLRSNLPGLFIDGLIVIQILILCIYINPGDKDLNKIYSKLIKTSKRRKIYILYIEYSNEFRMTTLSLVKATPCVYQYHIIPSAWLQPGYLDLSC